MLKTATVTMPYSELKELIDENERLKSLTIKPLTDDEFEEDPLKQGLDNIFDIMESASKANTAATKQYFIYLAMIEYCNAFKIPFHEILPDEAIAIAENKKDDKGGK